MSASDDEKGPPVLPHDAPASAFNRYMAYYNNFNLRFGAPAHLPGYRADPYYYSRRRNQGDPFQTVKPLPPREKRFRWTAKKDDQEDEYYEEEEDLGLFGDSEGSSSSSTSSSSASNSHWIEARKEEHAMLEKGWVPFFPSSAGDVLAWGKGIDGQLGSSRLVDSERPNMIRALSHKGIVAIACGNTFTIASTATGDVYTWGSSKFALANGTLGQQPIPRLVHGLTMVNVRKVVAGDNFGVALTDMGKLYTWGENDYGQLGVGSFISSSQPVLVPKTSGLEIVDVAAGPHYVLCKSKQDSVYGWGRAQEGQLALDSHYNAETEPVQIKSLFQKGIKLFACGTTHACGILNDGVYRWGTLTLSARDSVVCRIPEKLPTEFLSADHNISQVVCGDAHVLLLVDNGDVFSFGSNSDGQLGFSAQEKFTGAPTRVALETSAVAIAARANFSAAISKSGEVFEWGARGVGAYRRAHVSPIVVAGLEKVGVRSISCGLGHVVALVSKLSQVGSDLSSLVNSSHMSDIVLATHQGIKYNAHSAIVAARCGKLRPQVEAAVSSGSNEIMIEVDEEDTMMQLLQYFYTDYVKIDGVTSDAWRRLQKVADFYGIERLSAICHAMLQPHLHSSDQRRINYVPAPSLEGDLHDLINSEQLSDTTFKIIEQDMSTVSIHAHRAILYARSPYFKVMLDSGMSDAQRGGVIEVRDTAGVVFAAILEYLYSSVVSLDPSYVVDLFVAAHKYRISALKQQCEMFISENLDSENVLSLLTVSVLYESPSLRANCRAFIKAHYDAVITSAEMQEVSPEIAKEVQSIKPEESEALAKQVKSPSTQNTVYNKVLQESKALFDKSTYDDDEEYYDEEEYDSEEEEYLAPSRENNTFSLGSFKK